MFRYLATIVLLFAFALQVFNRSVIVLDYYANTASFAKACENKARPLLHCNGKCQMMKKLKEEEKKEQQNPERRSGSKEEVVSSKSFFTPFLHQRAGEKKVYSVYHSIFAPRKSLADIFRPPAYV